MSRRLAILFIVVVVVMASLACFFTLRDRQQPRYDIELFSDPSCMSACWQNLRVGTNSTKELEDFLNTHPAISNVNIEQGLSISGLFAYFTYKQGVEVRFQVDRESLTLAGIYFLNNIDLTAEMILDVLGEPDSQEVKVERGESFGEKDHGSIELFYFDKGYRFLFLLNENPDDTFCHKGDSYVKALFVGIPGDIENIMTIGYRYRWNEEWLNELVPWEGYQCYKLD